MSKKPFTPNTQEFYERLMSDLNQALELLTDKRTSSCTPGTYLGLAVSKAVTVNYYAKDMLSDARRASLEALEKLAGRYDAAVFTRLDSPAEDNEIGQAAHNILIEQTKDTDIVHVRQQLIDGIRAWIA